MFDVNGTRYGPKLISSYSFEWTHRTRCDIETCGRTWQLVSLSFNSCDSCKAYIKEERWTLFDKKYIPAPISPTNNMKQNCVTRYNVTEDAGCVRRSSSVKGGAVKWKYWWVRGRDNGCLARVWLSLVGVVNYSKNNIAGARGERSGWFCHEWLLEQSWHDSGALL